MDIIDRKIYIKFLVDVSIHDISLTIEEWYILYQKMDDEMLEVLCLIYGFKLHV